MSGIPVNDYAQAQYAQVPSLRSNDCELIVRQQPIYSRVEVDRKPVDPPPIVQLKIHTRTDPDRNYLQKSSNAGAGSGAPANPGSLLGGTIVSSLHRLKDPETQQDGAYFVFGDLSVKLEGTFKLQFNLFELRGDVYQHMTFVESKDFLVHSTKTFPGMNESTKLTRAFAEQGVRLRIRKEPRALLRKRGPASDDYQPRQYTKKLKGQESNTGSQPVNKYAEKEVSNPTQSMQKETFDRPSRTQQGQQRQQYTHLPASSLNSYIEEAQNKQERTGSDPRQQQTSQQSPSFGNGSFERYDWPKREYVEMQGPTQGPTFANQHLPQQTQSLSYDYSSSNYAQSPQLLTTPIRDQFFASRMSNTHLESPQPDASHFELHSQRSPPTFYPQLPNIPYGRGMQSSIPGAAGPSPPQGHSINYHSENLMYTSRSPHVGVDVTSTPLSSSVLVRGTMSSEFMPYGRREDFDTFPGQSTLGMSDFSEQLPEIYAPRSTLGHTSAVTTTAPDMGHY
ncbi:velvet factor protein [Rutstroemia sp. NJR-2017a WRK4]|nr:velvet factor protein [Rutstroemia sp. NJR-2017a WRK4]